MTEAKQKRHWFRYSLRTFLVFVTIFSLWLGIKVNAAHSQREAVAAIAKAGGAVWYDYQLMPWPRSMTLPGIPSNLPVPDDRIDVNASQPGPAWLRACIGDDYFRTVVAVYFNYPKPTIEKADFDQLAKLPRLKHFVLQG